MTHENVRKLFRKARKFLGGVACEQSKKLFRMLFVCEKDFEKGLGRERA